MLAPPPPATGCWRLHKLVAIVTQRKDFGWNNCLLQAARHRREAPRRRSKAARRRDAPRRAYVKNTGAVAVPVL